VEQRTTRAAGQTCSCRLAGNRSVVCAASYEARGFGVRSAMPASRAERLCPNAVSSSGLFKVPGRLCLVRDIFKRTPDLVEPLSLDEAYLDVTENKTGLPTATRVARTIRDRYARIAFDCLGRRCAKQILAKIASDWRKPDVSSSPA